MLLESLVNKHFNSLLNWIEPTSGKTGLDFIMQFVAKLLQPSDQENQGIHVGNLITRLIQRGGSSLAPILSDLLSAVATRLFTAKIPSFIQSLVMVFAHLIVREQFELDIIISFLMNLNHQGKNGLVEFISIWCEYHSSFIGYYDVKISSLALSKLYAKCDERVSGILVKGDIIATTRIITRSRAKTTPDQFTCVSFSIKVVKLLLGDFMNNNDIEPVKKSTGKKDSSDEDDDDEWQDDVYGIGNDLMGKMLNDDDVSDSRIGGSCFSDDPLYNYDIKEHINSFMKTCVNQNVGGIKAFSETDLTQVERETLHKICR